MTTDLAAEICRLGREGAGVGREIERAQGASPMGEHFDRVVEEFERGPFTVVLLGLNEEARSAALGALAGGAHRNLSVAMPRGLGLVEVRLEDRGYAVELPGVPRREFDDFQPFAAALQESRAVRDVDAAALLEPIRVRVQADAAMRGVSVLIPESLKTLRDEPRIVTRLRGRTNTLCIAGAFAGELDDETRAVVAEVTGLFSIVLPLVCGEAGEQSSPARGFFNDRSLLRCDHVLPASRVTPAGRIESGLLATHDDPVRSLCRAAFFAGRLRAGVSMMRSELAEDREVVRSHQASLGRELEQADKVGAVVSRGTIDAGRDELWAELRGVAEAVEEVLRKASLPEGPLAKTSERLSREISEPDLAQEAISGSGSVRLRLDEGVSARLADGMIRSLRGVIDEVARTIAERARKLQHQAADLLGSLRGETATLTLPGLDAGALHRRLRDAFAVRLECRAELEKHSFLRRLAKGRQAIFTVLMTVSLFGGVLGIGRQDVTIPIIMLPLFVSGLVMTYFSFARQDRDRIRRELDRIRDQAHQQLQRQSADSMRDVQERVRKKLDEWREQIQRLIDAAARAAQEAAAKEAKARRDEARARMKVQDQRDREIQGLERRISDLDRAATELERRCGAALRDGIRGMGLAGGDA